MDNSSLNPGNTIQKLSKAFSEWTVERHAELDSSLADRYGEAWRKQWLAEVEGKIAALGQALVVKSPAVFARSIERSEEAYSPRNVSPKDLHLSLSCLRDVLKEELPAGAWKVTEEFFERAFRVFDRDKTTQSPSTEPPLNTLALNYLRAALERNSNVAQELILEAAENGMSLETLNDDVLHPALVELGRLWYLGDISVADEHFVTGTTQTVLVQLRRHWPKVTSKDRLVVSTSVCGDLHQIGVRMVADRFEMNGWRAHYLGADTPIHDLISMLSSAKADLLTLSASTHLHMQSVAETILRIRNSESCKDIKILVGGCAHEILADIWQELGADGCGSSATHAVQLAKEFFDRPNPA